MLRWRPLPRLLVLTLPLAALMSAAAANAGSKQQLYAVGKPVCKAPKQLLTAHKATCTALRRVLVKAGTKGALPFTPAAGATGAATMGPNLGLTPSDIVSAYHLTTSPTAGSGQTVALVDAFNDPEHRSGSRDVRHQLRASDVHESERVPHRRQPDRKHLGPSGQRHDRLVRRGVARRRSRTRRSARPATSSSSRRTPRTTPTSPRPRTRRLRCTPPRSATPSASPRRRPTRRFQSAFDHPGIVITASSGDDGYYSFDWLGIFGPADVNAPDIPSAYPTVVAVGGTSLYLGQNATRASETVWNDNGPQAFYEANLSHAARRNRRRLQHACSAARAGRHTRPGTRPPSAARARPSGWSLTSRWSPTRSRASTSTTRTTAARRSARPARVG